MGHVTLVFVHQHFQRVRTVHEADPMAGNEQVLLQVWNSLLVLPGTAAQ
jgi:hypothetical protein